MFWKICFAAALFLCAATLAAVILSWKPGHASSKTRLFIAMAGAFAVTFVLLLPYFREFEVPVLSRIVLDLHATAQAFTLDIPIEDILTGLTAAHPGTFYAVYGRLIAVFAILCPVFTVGFLLSLVRNFWSLLRLAVCFRRHAYVFSELNEMSLAFAQGVTEEKKGLAVFAGVRSDTDPALTAEAERLHALCFSRSVENLPIRRSGKRGVHFLLMEQDESSALSTSLALAKKYRSRPNTQVVLYASSETAGNVIDSVENISPTLGDQLAEKISKNVDLIWNASTWTEKDALVQTDSFYLRRVDPIRELARNTLIDENLILHLKEQSAGSKTISLMIIGAGQLGKDLMKTAVWLYQVAGYTVEINLFDQRVGIRQQLEQECPELFDETCGKGNGDASYQIRVFSGVDCFSSTFERQLTPEQLLRTQAVFVTMGDDDLNVRAAIRLRALFDRLHGKHTVKKDVLAEAQPWIYAVVYNDEKMERLAMQSSAAETAAEKRSRLQNYREENYEIRLIGSLSSRFCPQSLEKYEKTEREAIARHLSWAVSNHYLLQLFETDEAFRKDYTERSRKHGVPEKNIRPNDLFEGDFKKELEKNVKLYFAYEYYRDSSVATKLHKEDFWPKFTGNAKETIETRKALLTARGEDVCDRRLTEHIRWNAYMRSIGYRRGARFDRGLVHGNLVRFDELSPEDQFKD